jgi:hypothetical protein
VRFVTMLFLICVQRFFLFFAVHGRLYDVLLLVVDSFLSKLSTVWLCVFFLLQMTSERSNEDNWKGQRKKKETLRRAFYSDSLVLLLARFSLISLLFRCPCA